MRAVVAGPDGSNLAAALAAAGADVVAVDGVVTRESLVAADVAAADVLVLTSMDDATGIAVAKDVAPDLRVVTYADGSLPEFARAQTDLALDPALFATDVVAEELVDGRARDAAGDAGGADDAGGAGGAGDAEPAPGPRADGAGADDDA